MMRPSEQYRHGKNTQQHPGLSEVGRQMADFDRHFGFLPMESNHPSGAQFVNPLMLKHYDENGVFRGLGDLEERSESDLTDEAYPLQQQNETVFVDTNIRAHSDGLNKKKRLCQCFALMLALGFVFVVCYIINILIESNKLGTEAKRKATEEAHAARERAERAARERAAAQAALAERDASEGKKVEKPESFWQSPGNVALAIGTGAGAVAGLGTACSYCCCKEQFERTCGCAEEEEEEDSASGAIGDGDGDHDDEDNDDLENDDEDTSSSALIVPKDRGLTFGGDSDEGDNDDGDEDEKDKEEENTDKNEVAKQSKRETAIHVANTVAQWFLWFVRMLVEILRYFVPSTFVERLKTQTDEALRDTQRAVADKTMDLAKPLGKLIGAIIAVFKLVIPNIFFKDGAVRKIPGRWRDHGVLVAFITPVLLVAVPLWGVLFAMKDAKRGFLNAVGKETKEQREERKQGEWKKYDRDLEDYKMAVEQMRRRGVPKARVDKYKRNFKPVPPQDDDEASNNGFTGFRSSWGTLKNLLRLNTTPAATAPQQATTAGPNPVAQGNGPPPVGKWKEWAKEWALGVKDTGLIAAVNVVLMFLAGSQKATDFENQLKETLAARGDGKATRLAELIVKYYKIPLSFVNLKSFRDFANQLAGVCPPVAKFAKCVINAIPGAGGLLSFAGWSVIAMKLGAWSQVGGLLLSKLHSLPGVAPLVKLLSLFIPSLAPKKKKSGVMSGAMNTVAGALAASGNGGAGGVETGGAAALGRSAVEAVGTAAKTRLSGGLKKLFGGAKALSGGNRGSVVPSDPAPAEEKPL